MASVAWEFWLELYTYGTAASTQSAATVAGTGRQIFTGSLSATQAAAILAAVGRQDFRATGATTQAPAVVVGSESERFIGQGSVSQSPPTLQGTDRAGAAVLSTGIVVADSRRPLPPIPRDPYMPDPTGSGHVTQAVPTAAATGAVSDPDEWLLLVA